MVWEGNQVHVEYLGYLGLYYMIMLLINIADNISDQSGLGVHDFGGFQQVD